MTGRLLQHGPKHLRWRLTRWHVCVLAAVLVFFSALTSSLLFWQFRSQLDNYLVQDVETIEGLLFFTPDGQLRLKEDYHNHPESKQVLERLLEVRSPDGAILFRNDRLGKRSLGGKPFPDEGVGGYWNRSRTLSDGTRVRMVSRHHAIDGRPTVIRLAYSEELMWRHVAELLVASLLALPLTLAVAGLADYALAKRALAPLEQMARRAEEITSERLDARLPAENADIELGRLARAFNDTLARLEQSFDQLKRFTSDASHELRTPLAAMRSVGEVGLQKDGGREEYRDIIGSMLEEVNRLTRLVDTLLTISRADSGTIQFHRSVFSVMELARDTTALFEVLMEEKSQRLILTGDELLTIEGDRLFIRQSLVNIIQNAVKYSPEGGTIVVNVRRDGESGVAIDVTDTGPGISEEHTGKVFDRFYRVDKSRSRSEGGAGLGLSIANWAVKAHGGRIALASTPGSGSTFKICLPVVSPKRP